ncbi:MAG: hypothetical protein ABSD79_04495 [Dehalococcoidales bacterium]|jgi:hypothetical protein
MPNSIDISRLKDTELLGLYADLMEELRHRGILRTSNNPVADYAEYVAVERLHLIRSEKEEKGCDATDNKGKRYQIKGRRLTRHNASRQLGVIRNIEKDLFNSLIVVIFAEHFELMEIWQISISFVKAHSSWSEHQHGHIFIADKSLLEHAKGVVRIF